MNRDYEDAQRRTARSRRAIDDALRDWGFTPSHHVHGIIALYTTCRRCGALLLVTDPNAPKTDDVEYVPNVVRHWRHHHPVRYVLGVVVMPRLPLPVAAVALAILRKITERNTRV